MLTVNNEIWRDRLPKKVNEALRKLGIKGVVGGYFTVTHYNILNLQAAFTCWDKNGLVICVLYKPAGQSEWEWKIVENTLAIKEKINGAK